MYKRFINQSNFQILTVDVQEGSKIVGAYLKGNGYHFPTLLDPSGEVAERYSAQTIPLSVIIDADGTLIGYRLGRTDWSSPIILRGIDTLLHR
jgi:transcriptional regulator of nitric oxide reductase